MDTAEVVAPDVSRTALRELGRAFHQQLAHLDAETHGDDEGHDVAVGTAIFTAICDRDPARAERTYNEWARSHGYADIHHLKTFVNQNGGVVYQVDIASQIILFDESCHVFVEKD